MTRRNLRNGVADPRGLSSAGLRMLGIMLISLGLIVVSMAFLPEGESEGVVVIFPFVFGNVGGGAAVALTIMFFIFFVISSILPWYMLQRRSGLDDRFVILNQQGRSWGRDSETMEYIITTELPDELRHSIYIEADQGSIRLRSTEDEDFLRSYNLPRGFEVDEIDYDYEGNYLVLKLQLKRSA